jgi:ubiquinone/menaquinone biosynthesis C-methylase UbiE
MQEWSQNRMSCGVCSWWIAYFIDNRFRRLIHNPDQIFQQYVQPGMTVLDLGCGMGFSSLAIARIVGDEGCVIAVDLQEQMLRVLEKRAAKAGLSTRIRTHLCGPDEIGVNTPVDFAVAFWMVHEVPDVRSFLAQVRSCLKPGARFLVAEPLFHVSGPKFEEMVASAGGLGLKFCGEPKLRISRSAVFAREG